MKCPKCGLYNPDNAARCDCGYDFGTGKIEKSYLYSGATYPQYKPRILLHLGLMILATAIFVLIIEYKIHEQNAYHNIFAMLGRATVNILIPVVVVGVSASIYWLIKRQVMPGIIGSGWFIWVICIALDIMSPRVLYSL